MNAPCELPPSATIAVHRVEVVDLDGLAELYVDLLGGDAVGLRLEVIECAMCPRFHVDHVGIRMLCTFCGPGRNGWTPPLPIAAFSARVAAASPTRHRD